MHAGYEYVRSRDRHWVVHPTPYDPFAPYGVYRDSEWLAGAVSIQAGQQYAQKRLDEEVAS